MTTRNGRVVNLENVYVRGGRIKLIVLPEMLKNAPVFKKVQGQKRTRQDNYAENKSIKKQK